MLRSAKFILSLGAVLIAVGVANAAPKESAADGKVCQAGVGKPYVAPMFANGKAVSQCEVGNAGFFSRSCEQPSKAALASASAGGSCCAGEKSAAHALPAGHPKVAGKAMPAGHPKVAAHDCGEKALGVMACEVGNRHFFTASNCGPEMKAAKGSCCSAK